MAQYKGIFTWYDSKRCQGGVERDEDKKPFRFNATTDEVRAEMEQIAVGDAVEFDLQDSSPLAMIVFAENVHKL